MKLIETQATKVIKDMEHTNIVTFNNVPTEFVEHNGETYTAKSFTCYNWEVTLNGENVCIKPSWYDGNLRKIEIDHDDHFHSDELWVLFNTKKVLIWNSTKQEFLGEVTKVLDPRNQAERIRDLQAEGKL